MNQVFHLKKNLWEIARQGKEQGEGIVKLILKPRQFPKFRE